jgi:hypothetical protein
MICTCCKKVINILSIDQSGICLLNIGGTIEAHRAFGFIHLYFINSALELPQTMILTYFVSHAQLLPHHTPTSTNLIFRYSQRLPPALSPSRCLIHVRSRYRYKTQSCQRHRDFTGPSSRQAGNGSGCPATISHLCLW